MILQYLLLLLASTVNAISFRQCTSNAGCFGSSEYCYQVIPTYSGLCLDCWSCCMYPEKFGACPTKCTCRQDNASCSTHEVCGRGKFCTRLNTCKSCLEVSAADAIDINICPNRQLAGTNDESGIAFHDFYAFFIMNNEAGNIISEDSLSLWISRQKNTLFPVETINYKTASDMLRQRQIALNNCPRNNVSDVGCPCIPLRNARSYRCPAGQYCTRNRYEGTSNMIFYDPYYHTFQGICQPCRPGDYCPEGTVLDLDTETIFNNLKCPTGHYCPNPAIKIPCTNGTYCATGFTRPLTCDYNILLKTEPYIPKRPDTVIERLIGDKDPYIGNFCPVMSEVPYEECTAGYYCPSANQSTICPSGYYCPVKSFEPKKCPILSKCPQGSIKPANVFIPYLFTICVIVAIVILLLVRKRFEPSRESRTKTIANVAMAPPTISLEPLRQRRLSAPPPTLFDIVKNINIPITIQNTQTNFPYIKPLELISLKNISAPWLAANNATFEPRKLNVIIGGSGCGKSTFLDLLRGNVPMGKLTGSVHIKVKDEPEVTMDLTRLEKHRQWSEFRNLKTVRGYVPQDDILYGELTVEENLLYSAYLKAGISTKEKAIADTTEMVLRELGLAAIKDKIVGSVERRGISGGQRKRVNIGMEVVTLPSLLIMDEPTSGLDANGCQRLIEFCKNLTKMNITVINVIHQPRYTSFILFDHLLLLSKYGTLYEGPAITSLLYFNYGLNFKIDKNENPADVLMDIISGSRGVAQDELVNIWRDNGIDWVKMTNKKYPFHSDILQYDIVVNPPTLAVLDALLPNQETLNHDDILSLFNKLYIPYTGPTLSTINRQTFLTLFKETCSSGFLSLKYDNVIDKLTLLKWIPGSVINTFDQLQASRHIYLAWKFGKRLLNKVRQRADANINIDTSKTTEQSNDLTEPLLLTCMTCKAISQLYRDYKERENIILIHYNYTCRDTVYNKLKHLYYILKRRLIIIFRSPWPIQLLIPIVAAFIIGKIQGYNQAVDVYPNNIISAMVCLGALSMITHVRTFSLDKVIIRRETDCKIGMIPFYIGYNIIDALWIITIPLMFTFPYYYLTLPQTNFGYYYLVGMMICWWTSGMAYVISALPLAMHWVNLISVFVSVIFGAFLHGIKPAIHEVGGTFQGFMVHLSYNRWAMEILTLEEYSYYEIDKPNIIWGVIDKIGLCGADGTLFDIDMVRPSLRKLAAIQDIFDSSVKGECSEYIIRAFLWLMAYGIIFRVLAIFILYYNTHPIWARFHWLWTDTLFKRFPRYIKYKCGRFF